MARTVNMKVLTCLLVVTLGVNVQAYPFLDHDYERTALGDSIDKASLKLLKEAYNAGGNKNVIASPLGVMILLSMYSAGAGNTSREEITRALGVSDYKQLTDSYMGLSHEFGNMNPDFLTLANQIYVDKKYELNQDFSRTTTDYRSKVESMDFQDPVKAAGIINKWADDKTKGHIKDPVSADALDPDTVVGLFNIIFFQGHWHVPFKASETVDKDFHVDSKTTVKKPTMHLEQSLFYTESEELGARMIELPYKEQGFRMVIVLPNEVEGLSSVIEKAATKGILEDVFKMEPSGRDVILDCPKFEIKSKLNLKDLLPKVGISSIFSEGANGIVKSDTVVVSKAFQEAFVKVDEEGATAGAFTGLLAVPPSWPPPPPPKPLEFKVDRPFLFFIMQRDKVLFSGTYAE